MTYVVPDPRTLAFARIPANRCLVICNSDRAWSVSAGAAYAAARGIPADNILSLAMGTTSTWTPPNNAAIGVVAAAINAKRLERNARAALIAPGCPNRVRVVGVTPSGVNYNPTETGLPSFGQLVMGSPSYASLFSGSNILSCREQGSGRWTWFVYTGNISTTVEAWNARVAWRLGLSDVRSYVDPSLEETGLRPASWSGQVLAPGSLPTPLATTYAGWSGCRVMPAGRIGWGAWRLPSVDFVETEVNWNGPLNSSLAADSYTSQPGRLLFSLDSFNADSLSRWSDLAYRARVEWGYDVGYFYRTTSIPASVEARNPVAGAVWTKAAFEGGSIVDEPYYLYCGDAKNTDDPVRSEPYKSALAPLPGAVTCELGPSYGFEWGIRGLQTGAAMASMDITHRTSGESTIAWFTTWQMLRGMSGIEAWVSPSTAPFSSGDPLHRPFHFDAAPALDLVGDDFPPLPPVTPPFPDNTANSPYRTWRPRAREPRRLGYRR
jgi:hypothetical protein